MYVWTTIRMQYFAMQTDYRSWEILSHWRGLFHCAICRIHTADDNLSFFFLKKKKALVYLKEEKNKKKMQEENDYEAYSIYIIEI